MSKYSLSASQIAEFRGRSMGGTPSFAEFNLMKVSRNSLFCMLDHLVVKEFQVPTGIVHLTNSCGYGSPYSMHKVFI
jgi:hypothetical protein